jgi:hypothetical protein
MSKVLLTVDLINTQDLNASNVVIANTIIANVFSTNALVTESVTTNVLTSNISYFENVYSNNLSANAFSLDTLNAANVTTNVVTSNLLNLSVSTGVPSDYAGNIGDMRVIGDSLYFCRTTGAAGDAVWVNLTSILEASPPNTGYQLVVTKDDVLYKSNALIDIISM